MGRSAIDGAEVEASIADHGLYIAHARDWRGRLFSHTIGLTDNGWPELIIAGPSPEVATQCLHRAVLELMEFEEVFGQGPHPGSVVLDAFFLPGRLRAVDPVALLGYMQSAIDRQQLRGGPMPTALQLVWPDEDWQFPEDETCSPCIRDAQELDCCPRVH